MEKIKEALSRAEGHISIMEDSPTYYALKELHEALGLVQVELARLHFRTSGGCE